MSTRYQISLYFADYFPTRLPGLMEIVKAKLRIPLHMWSDSPGDREMKIHAESVNLLSIISVEDWGVDLVDSPKEVLASLKIELYTFNRAPFNIACHVKYVEQTPSEDIEFLNEEDPDEK